MKDKISDDQAIAYFRKMWGLDSWGRLRRLFRPSGYLIVAGNLAKPPEWWLREMEARSEIGRKHLEVLKRYLQKKREGEQ